MPDPDVKIAGRTLAEWAEFARRDDCLERMVPSDLRQLIGKIATPSDIASAGGGEAVRRTGAQMIEYHRFTLHEDGNTAEIDSNGLAEEIDAALATPPASAAPAGVVEAVEAFEKLLRYGARGNPSESLQKETGTLFRFDDREAFFLSDVDRDCIRSALLASPEPKAVEERS